MSQGGGGGFQPQGGFNQQGYQPQGQRYGAFGGQPQFSTGGYDQPARNFAPQFGGQFSGQGANARSLMGGIPVAGSIGGMGMNPVQGSYMPQTGGLDQGGAAPRREPNPTGGYGPQQGGWNPSIPTGTGGYDQPPPMGGGVSGGGANPRNIQGGQAVETPAWGGAPAQGTQGQGGDTGKVAPPGYYYRSDGMMLMGSDPNAMNKGGVVNPIYGNNPPPTGGSRIYPSTPGNIYGGGEQGQFGTPGYQPGSGWQQMQNLYAQQRQQNMGQQANFGRYPDGTPIADPSINFRRNALQGRFGGGWDQ